MSLLSVQGVIGKLADSRAKLDMLVKNHQILANQARRTADFQKQFAAVIRFDWLDFAQAVRTLEAKMEDAFAYEAGLRAKLAAWTNENLSSGATFPKIDLTEFGISTVAGINLAGLGIPTNPRSYLGEGSVTDIAAGFLTLNQKAQDALGLIANIEKAHMSTLMKAREVLRAKNPAAASAISGVIAQNTADSTRIGTDPTLILFAVLGALGAWKAWGWWRKRKGVAHAS